MIAQNYSLLYQTYAKERRKLGLKIRNSLIGRFESTPFSAYNIFENYHHRALVRATRILAQKMTLTGHAGEAQMLKAMCDGYGVSQVLEDGPLSLLPWSWATTVTRGNRNPYPMSSMWKKGGSTTTSWRKSMPNWALTPVQSCSDCPVHR